MLLKFLLFLVLGMLRMLFKLSHSCSGRFAIELHLKFNNTRSLPSSSLFHPLTATHHWLAGIPSLSIELYRQHGISRKRKSFLLKMHFILCKRNAATIKPLLSMRVMDIASNTRYYFPFFLQFSRNFTQFSLLDDNAKNIFTKFLSFNIIIVSRRRVFSVQMRARQNRFSSQELLISVSDAFSSSVFLLSPLQFSSPGSREEIRVKGKILNGSKIGWNEIGTCT